MNNYYKDECLNDETTSKFPPHMGKENSTERNVTLNQIYQDKATLDMVDEGLVKIFKCI